MAARTPNRVKDCFGRDGEIRVVNGPLNRQTLCRTVASLGFCSPAVHGPVEAMSLCGLVWVAKRLVCAESLVSPPNFAVPFRMASDS